MGPPSSLPEQIPQASAVFAAMFDHLASTSVECAAVATNARTRHPPPSI